jgi:3-oxoacyl-[acyl-carrier-protein] synthase III
MAKIINTGFSVPEIVLKNSDISDSPEWVSSVLGIEERRNIGKESIVDLCVQSVDGFDLKKVDVLIVATATPEAVAPSTACLVAKELNLVCPAFDINAVCSGFLYGLILADSLINSGARNVLVIGADTFSKITDFTDRNCVFFGDGAGAVLLSKGNNFKYSYWGTDHFPQGFECDKNGTFKMDGRIVYDIALKLIPEAVDEVLTNTGWDIEDIDYMVPHQPSIKILSAIAEEIGIAKDKVLMNMHRYGNTSAATIPILLAESWDKFKKGDKILFASIGSGWAYGAITYQV